MACCGGAEPPKPPDPNVTAAAQAAANIDTAEAQQAGSLINQYTPYGSIEYTKLPGTGGGKTAQQAYSEALTQWEADRANIRNLPLEAGQAELRRLGDAPTLGQFRDEVRTPTRYEATQTLSPDEQKKLEQANLAEIQFGRTALDQLGSARERLAQPFDLSTLGEAPQANEQTRQAVAQALYDRLNPQLDRDMQRLQSRLYAQGHTEGTPGWDEAMADFERNRTDTRLGVEDRALGQMAQLYGLERGERDQAINEMLMQRTQPLNELAAMLSGQQVNAPSFVPTPQMNIAPTDIVGPTYASYQGQLNNYNQQLGQQNAAMGGLFDLGAAAIMGPAGGVASRALRGGGGAGSQPYQRLGGSTNPYTNIWGD